MALITLPNIIIALSILLFLWYFAGAYLNRRRAVALIHAVSEAVGSRLLIRWYGRSAFHLDVGQPPAPLTDLRFFCLLEPRDFALALAWNRLRGRRDMVMLTATYPTPLPALVRHPLSSYGIPGLTELEIKPVAPHVRATLQVGAGNEELIRQTVDLLRQFGQRKRA
jgi:hypothetical protein